jgi:hypothetical protein
MPKWRKDNSRMVSTVGLAKSVVAMALAGLIPTATAEPVTQDMGWVHDSYGSDAPSYIGALTIVFAAMVAIRFLYWRASRHTIDRIVTHFAAVCLCAAASVTIIAEHCSFSAVWHAIRIRQLEHTIAAGTVGILAMLTAMWCITANVLHSKSSQL